MQAILSQLKTLPPIRVAVFPVGGQGMKLLVVMPHSGYLRLYESSLRSLALAGHDLVVGFTQAEKEEKAIAAADASDADFPGVHFMAQQLPVRDDAWRPVLRFLWSLMDVIFYVNPLYRARARGADYLRERAETFAPADLSKRFRRLASRSPFHKRLVNGALRAVQRGVPTFGPIDRVLRDIRPDGVILTFMVDFSSVQVDYAASARALGIPTVYSVASWDNLSNKGVLKVLPDRILVWNRHQQREAALLHGYPEGRVVATGAQPWDHWFAMAPCRSRAELLAEAGLPADSRYIVYVGSSPSICDFAFETKQHLIKIIRALRQHPDARVRDIQVIVRPHYQTAQSWATYDLGAHVTGAVVYPALNKNSFAADDRQTYYDTLHHAEAVFGINTSAMAEAAILGKPVLSRLQARAQFETLHFDYLRQGMLYEADEPTAFADLVAQALDGQLDGAARGRAFVEDFIRPAGVDVPAADIFARAVEETVAAGCANNAATFRASSLLLRPLARLAAPTARRRIAVVDDYRLAVKRRVAWRPVDHARNVLKLYPRVLLGLVVRDGEDWLERLVESVLAQTARNFILVIFDECSRDGTAAIGERLTRQDPRILYYRNVERIGLVNSRNAVFKLATRVAPDAPYFAWIDGIDSLADDWLESLLAALDGDDRRVGAYALAARGGGSDTGAPRHFDTDALESPLDRTRLTCRFGWTFAEPARGLYRAAAVEQCGVQRGVRDPERALLTELASHGGIFCEPRPLVTLRPDALDRQRPETLYVGHRPLASRLPMAAALAALFMVKARRALRRGGGRDVVAAARTLLHVMIPLRRRV